MEDPESQSQAELHRLLLTPPKKETVSSDWERRHRRLIEEQEAARLAVLDSRLAAYETTPSATEVEPAAPSAKIETGAPRNGRAWLAVAGLLLAAGAIGPLLYMNRPLEPAPPVFSTLDVGVVTAPGLPAPMSEPFAATVSGKWTLISLRAPSAPIDVALPSIPSRATNIASWTASPVFGASVSGIETGARISPVTIPSNARRGVSLLPSVLPEAELDANGVALRQSNTLIAVTRPAPRPLF